MDSKTLLKTYIDLERMKPTKDMLVSIEVLNNFRKLLKSKGKNQDYLREQAVKQYQDAVRNGKKISRFSLQHKSPLLEERRNRIRKYNEQTQEHLNNFMNVEDHNEKTIGKKITVQKGKKTIRTIETEMTSKFLPEFMYKEAKKIFERDIKNVKKEFPQFKINCHVEAEFVKLFQDQDDDGKLLTVITDRTKSHITVIHTKKVQTTQDINNLIDSYEGSIKKVYEEIILKTSGWSFYKSLKHVTEVYNYEKKRGKSFIPTPIELKNAKYGIVNPKNDDDKCFMYATAIHKIPKSEHFERLSVVKKYTEEYNYDGLDFPVALDDIHIFEMNNNVNITVFEYNYDLKEPHLVRRSNGKASENIFLLLLRDGEKYHYCYLRSLGMLRASVEQSKKTCNKCFGAFTEKQFAKHQCSLADNCEGFKTVIEYPGKEECIKFDRSKLKNTLMQPFVCYADFEAFNKKTKDDSKYSKHEVNSFAFNTVCNFDEKYNKFKMYRGDNAIDKLLNALLKEKDRVDKITLKLRNKYKDHNLSETEEKEFKTAEKCCYCLEKFTQNNYAVRDHCHLTGKYRGASCNLCNLALKNVTVKKQGENAKQDLIVVFHNLRGYDGHFIIQEAHKFTKNIKVIAQSFEKYMTFSFCGLRFIDSFQFLSDSLSNLTDSMTEKSKLGENEEGAIYYDYSCFKHMQKEYGELTPFMCRKIEYPYEWVSNKNCFDVPLDEMKKEYFYDSLSDTKIKDFNFEQFIYVKEKMKIKTFGEHHDLYLKNDVLLLSDIFENFRALSVKSYNLDPCNFISLPSMSWNAMMNMTHKIMDQEGKKFTLGYIHDEETRLFFEESKRGGIVQAGATRYCKANNKYMKTYDKTKPSNYIEYMDAVNLYGFAMKQVLPYELLGFRSDITLEKILDTPTDAEIGYYVECDITLRKELHKKFKDYPLFPVSRVVEDSELSPYQLNLKKSKSKSRKLILDLYDKKNYRVHYEYLKEAVRLGYEVKVNRVMEFKQSNWLAKYIDFNTDLRQKAGSNKFFKDFYKLMNNAVYGKTNENILGRSKIVIEQNEDLVKRRIGYDNFKRVQFQDDLFFVESHEEKVLYNKPSYIGNAILDISKICMLKFHYDYMQPKYGDNCELIYTDTDSFVYNVHCEDLYQDMYDNRNHFNLAEVKNKKFMDKTNDAKVGTMKPETGMQPIHEWIALGPKSYSYIVSKLDMIVQENDTCIKEVVLENKKTCKGCQKSVLKKEIKHDDYKNTLLTGKVLVKENRAIRSFKHELFSFRFKKDCLSAYDEKLRREDFNTGHPFGYMKN